MQDGDFSWHDEKAAINPRNHRGVTFEQAKAVFGDFAADEIEDDREDYGETRLNLTGRDANGNLLVVTYTMRGTLKHIISARKATRNERNAFYHAAQSLNRRSGKPTAAFPSRNVIPRQ